MRCCSINKKEVKDKGQKIVNVLVIVRATQAESHGHIQRHSVLPEVPLFSESESIREPFSTNLRAHRSDLVLLKYTQAFRDGSGLPSRKPFISFSFCKFDCGKIASDFPALFVSIVRQVMVFPWVICTTQSPHYFCNNSKGHTCGYEFCVEAQKCLLAQYIFFGISPGIVL